ncbi:MAG TPA: FAD:protein FMN transferase [Candidatus Nitrosotalea sp.]|nr:FAD:protein FMN transferase [Candidatus Nitrosotalea sp.]
MSYTLLGIADHRALGGSMRVVVTKPESLRAATTAVEQVVDAIDQAASRFRNDSELSRINASPERVSKLSPLLAQAIGTALRGAELSGGAVDPTIGYAIKLAGYDTDFAEVPADGVTLHLVEQRVPGWRVLEFDPYSRTLLLPKGVQLDLGATAKALAADLAAAEASKASGGAGVLVSLGGDIAVAGQAPAEGWSIQLSDDSSAPIDDSEETVAITSGGIATSSTTVRRWTRGGVVLHHIIDPETGLPVDSCWRSASVVAATCVDANIASTAAIVMGKGAVSWLESHGLAARLVDQEGKIHRVAGWPHPEAHGANSNLAPTVF